MRFLTIIPAILFPLLGAASPVQTMTSMAQPSADEAWVVNDVSRKRYNDNTLCMWKLQIKQTFISSSTATDPLACAFEAHVPKGHDCGVDEFGPAVCSKDVDSLYINIGHDSDGFVVMVVSNTETNGRAYFAFTDASLDSGDGIPPQTSPVQYSDPTAFLLARHDQNDDPDKQVWKIEKLSRRINNDTKSMIMSFAIYGSNDDDQDDDDPAVSCTLHLQAPENSNIAKWEFFDKKCDESDFYVSWGYLAASDAGIMTLVNPARDHEAWFGFPDISRSEELVPSLGGGVVEPCDCGAPHD
ncbi:hypothetical protein F5Y09DRAFT_295576 [Xylaria sp. FL1042]|nr:hypothetical protein F5Y09DRAFT_295576 [Xylaria sp. FL1042]